MVQFSTGAGGPVFTRRRHRALAIVCPPGPVRRLFELAGIADLLFLYASRDEAAAALVATG